MICPKCGENNSDNFRFCGMCGTLLEGRVEGRRPAGAPVPNLPSAIPQRISTAQESLPPVVVEAASRAPNKTVAPISGPSMLDLNQPGPQQPDTGSLRDSAFSGLDSFFEPEQPKTGGRRILLLVALLVALGAAGWWTYANYIGPGESRKTTAQDVAPTPDTGPSPAPPPAPAPSAKVPEGPSENAIAIPDSSQKSADAETKPAATPPKATLPEKIVPHEKSIAKREPHVAAPKAAKVPAPAAADTGDADLSLIHI